MTDQMIPETVHDETDETDDTTSDPSDGAQAGKGWTFVRDSTGTTTAVEPAEETGGAEVVVRRNGLLSILVAGVAALMSAAYFARAATTGGTLDWSLCIALAALTWAFVFSFLDARMPLLVADSHGIRIRLGRTWRGMAWFDLEEVEHLPRRGLFRDGRLVLFPRETEGELALLGPAGRRHARINERLFRAPFAVPLGLTTRVIGAHRDLTGALEGLAEGRCGVVEVVRAEEPEDTDGDTDGDTDEDSTAPVDGAGPDGPDASGPDVEVITDLVTDGVTDGVLNEATDELTDRDRDRDRDAAAEPEPTVPVVVVASPTPSPLREPVAAVRADLDRERTWDPDSTQAFAPFPSSTSTVVIGDLADVPLVDPVIGPQLRAARERLRLSVDQLAERTRIRPHVIEAIEIDDFVPCGGDFYARGHLRTLARVLGVDVTPLLVTYDETYADAPIDPRRVFEAELATGRHGSIRGTRGGPNWSIVLASVMVLVLAWSIARLVMDHPADVSSSSPSLADGSAGLTSGSTKLASPVPVVVTAAGGGARVVIRDGSGKVVFTGTVAFGQTKTVQASPPVRIQSSDGSTEVTVDGQDHGALGKTGEPAQDVFTVR